MNQETIFETPADFRIVDGCDQRLQIMTHTTGTGCADSRASKGHVSECWRVPGEVHVDIFSTQMLTRESQSVQLGQVMPQCRDHAINALRFLPAGGFEGRLIRFPHDEEHPRDQPAEAGAAPSDYLWTPKPMRMHPVHHAQFVESP